MADFLTKTFGRDFSVKHCECCELLSKINFGELDI